MKDTFIVFDDKCDRAENPYLHELTLKLRGEYQWGYPAPAGEKDLLKGDRRDNNEWRRFQRGAQARLLERFKIRRIWNIGGLESRNKYGNGRWDRSRTEDSPMGEIDIPEHIPQEHNTVYSIFRWGWGGGNREYKVMRRTNIPNYGEDIVRHNDDRIVLFNSNAKSSMCDVATGSITLVGSPTSRTFGSAVGARAMYKRCCYPPKRDKPADLRLSF